MNLIFRELGSGILGSTDIQNNRSAGLYIWGGGVDKGIGIQAEARISKIDLFWGTVFYLCYVNKKTFIRKRVGKEDF